MASYCALVCVRAQRALGRQLPEGTCARTMKLGCVRMRVCVCGGCATYYHVFATLFLCCVFCCAVPLLRVLSAALYFLLLFLAALVSLSTSLSLSIPALSLLSLVLPLSQLKGPRAHTHRLSVAATPATPRLGPTAAGGLKRLKTGPWYDLGWHNTLKRSRAVKRAKRFGRRLQGGLHAHTCNWTSGLWRALH